MKFPFRQGIIRYQNDIAGHAAHLQLGSPNKRYIDFIANEEPTVISFAYGDAEYIVEENLTKPKAWGPFPEGTGETYYLYWEIDMVSGEIRRGYTTFPPVTSAVQPTYKRAGQHWFDLSTKMMKVFDAKLDRYMPKLRVFAAVLNNKLTPFTPGTQVGLNVEVEGGFILFDEDMKPIRTSTGKFVTSAHAMIADVNSFNQPNSLTAGFRVEDNVILVTASSTIPKLHCVSIVGRKKVELASYRRTDRLVSGIVAQTFYAGEKGVMLTKGVLYDPNWNFPASHINKSLFCGLNGEVVMTPPPTGMSQVIGVLLDSDTVFFNPQPPIRLHD
jgi:hypothetical protein